MPSVPLCTLVPGSDPLHSLTTFSRSPCHPGTAPLSERRPKEGSLVRSLSRFGIRTMQTQAINKANRLNQIMQTPPRRDQAVRVSEQRSLRALKRRATNLERLDGNASICITRTSAQISDGMAYYPSGHHPVSLSFKPGPGWTYQPCPACWRAPHLE
jgi:hypothetical protein